MPASSRSTTKLEMSRKPVTAEYVRGSTGPGGLVQSRSTAWTTAPVASSRAGDGGANGGSYGVGTLSPRSSGTGVGAVERGVPIPPPPPPPSSRCPAAPPEPVTAAEVVNNPSSRDRYTFGGRGILGNPSPFGGDRDPWSRSLLITIGDDDADDVDDDAAELRPPVADVREPRESAGLAIVVGCS